MKTADLFRQYQNKEMTYTDRQAASSVNVSLLGEISLYQHFNRTDIETDLIKNSEINNQLNLLKGNGIKRLCLHFGYFFNANYESIVAYTEYILKRFDGDVFCFSPEELVYLSIIAHKEIDEIITDLKKIGVKSILGYLPKSIIESTYYAEDDELFIDDRHVVFDKLISNGIRFQYPMNLSQIETLEELTAVLDFIKVNKIEEIVIQPNRPIESPDEFDYALAQNFVIQLLDDFAIPLIEVNQEFDLLTNKGAYQYYWIEDNQLVTNEYKLSKDPRIKIA